MAQKQNEKESLKCTYRNCKQLQTEVGEFCDRHYPKAVNPFAESRVSEVNPIYSIGVKKFIGGLVIGLLVGAFITCFIKLNINI